MREFSNYKARDELQMSILEVYNKYYQQEIIDEYENDENHMPYMVLIREWKLREQFREELIILGYKCVAWNDSYPGVLVNSIKTIWINK